MARSLALNVEAIRARIIQGVAVPEELLRKALETTERNLSAKKIIFFSNKGVVKTEKIVENTEAQLRAADQVYTMAGIYTREKDTLPKPPSFAMRVNPHTGVVEILVGGDAADEADLIPLSPSSTRAIEAAPVPSESLPGDTVSPSETPRSARDAVSRILFDETE